MKSKKIRVCETFFSIQGEGSLAGAPCFFIRLSGCNLRCRWCDTSYAIKEEGKVCSPAELCTLAAEHPTAAVALTGGEPLLQPASLELMRLLIAEGHRVILETNGSIDISAVPEGVIRVVDIKCPGSGCGDSFLAGNYDQLNRDDEIKFVIRDREDFLFASETASRHGLFDKVRAVFISPVSDEMPPARAAELILASDLPFRLNLQLHRVIWPQKTRGV